MKNEMKETLKDALREIYDKGYGDGIDSAIAEIRKYGLNAKSEHITDILNVVAKGLEKHKKLIGTAS